MKKVFLLLTLIATTFSAWGADYTLYRNFDEIAKQMGLGDNVSTSTSPIVLDNVVSMSMSAGYRWEKAQAAIRFYKSNGEIKFKARDGVTIKTIKVTWSAWAAGGCLTTKTNGGTSITDPYIASSGSTITVNKNSISFWVGSTTTDDWRSIDITEVEIVYSDPTIFLEQYTAYPTTGGSSSITGDNGTYKWKINAQNRTQAVGSYSNCIKLQYGHSIASNGNLEGGIKSISFDWRTTGGNYPNHFFVKAGSINDEIYIASFNNTKRILNYSKDFGITSNTTLSISNPAEENPAQNHIAVAPVHITPYLLFTAPNHKVAVSYRDAQSYDLTKVLINNTGTTPTYTITSNGCGGSPSISNAGVVDFSTVTKNGDIAIKASWGDVYTTLTVAVTGVSELAFAETTKKVYVNSPAFINPLQNKGNGAVSYNSSDDKVATIANDGTISIVKSGSTTITATSEQTSLYAAGTATFELTVSPDLTPSPLMPVDITENKATIDITQDNGWTGSGNENPRTDIAYNGALQLTASAGNAKDVTSHKYFRYYQGSNKGQLTITAKPQKAVIKSATFTYTATSNQTLTKVYGADGVNIPTENRVSTGSPYLANANAFSLYTGSTAANVTGKSVDIGTYSVIYTDPTIVFERLQGYTSGTANVDGDNQLYKWKVNAQNHSEAVGAYNGIKIQDGNSIAMNGDQEGGIKSVSFDYKVLSTSAIGLNVTAGGTTHNFTHNAADASGRIFTYTHDFSKAENVALTIAMVSGKSAVAVGPIHITPYLLFNVANHAATLNAEDGTKCDLNSALINNTGETPTFTVEENTAGGNPQIENGILDFSSVVRSGYIKVQASWSGVTTTLKLNINLQPTSVKFVDTLATAKKNVGWYKQALTLVTPTSGTVSYKVVSKPDGATATMNEDTVRFDKVGDYIIRGILAANLPYGEDSAQYKLRVTDLKVPELSFAKDTVEQPISAATYKNELTTSVGVGDTTYDSSNKDVATVDSTGLVTLVAAGTTNITAYVAENDSFAAGQKSYFLKVYAMPVMSMGNDTNVYLNAPNFIRTASVTAGDGEISYSSSDDSKATVNASTGEVHIVGSGSVVITATMAKGATYWSGSDDYTIKVSDLKLPTASYSTTVVNKNQNDTAFTNNTLVTESDGVKTYESSDPRVATVDATTGKVTMGEKPGTTTISVKIDASATWEKVEASYTLIVSSAPIADMHVVSKTVGDLKGSQSWANGSQHPNLSLDDAITLSDGKYYPTTQGGEFRYYFASSASYVAGQFTIQAKAGVIIQSVKFTYSTGNDNMVLSKTYTSGFVGSADQIISGNTYKVDANAVTFYAGKKASASGNTHINVTGYEITYFDPSEGVAVTKMANDIGKDLGLTSGFYNKSLAINNVITLKATGDENMKYWNSGNINCYRKGGAIDFVARPGAKIHYLKLTYRISNNGILTKYWGTDGLNILDVDQISSDSIIYVNADSIRLYVGSTTSNVNACLEVTKIYVNYTDNSEVVVDNFNNCDQTSGDSVVVAGVDGKYDWTFKNFSRKDTITNRMYYDQSIKLSQNGKIYTEYTGGLKEVAFDWHPTSNAAVDFTVNAGDSSWNVNKAAQGGVYTFNFQKLNNKTNGEFSITVNGTTPIEIGHVSLTPYLLYTCKDTTIAANDYKDASWKFTNNTLINYTDEEIEYSTSDASIAEVNASTGEVTIKGGGTVIISATTKTTGVTASYQLKINLEQTSVKFNDTKVEKILSGVKGTHTQELTLVTAPESGNTIEYSITGNPADGASIKQNGEVTFTKTGVYYITGKLVQKLPCAAAEATYELTVSSNPVPHIYFATDTLNREITDGKFFNPLWTPGEGVGDTTYVSTDPTVASVDEFGEVTPLKVGETTIKAYVAEGSDYAADSAKYVLTVYQLPKPVMHFTESSVIAYLNTEPFTNTLIVEEGDGEISYKSEDVLVATVDNTGKVVVTGHGETTIKAISTKTANYQADSVNFTLTVKKQLLPAAWFTNTEVQKYLSAGTYTNTLNQNPVSDGAVTYESSNPSVASVTNAGVVTLKKNGSAIITATIAATTTYETATASYELTILADPIEDIGTVKGNVPHFADSLSWVSGDAAANCYRYFKLDQNVSIYSEPGNAMYKKDGEKKYLRYYQGSNKGQFTVRVPAGGIIQSVKFNYTAVNGGVLTTSYGSDGKSISDANQIKSGETFITDANFISFYTGNTGANTNGEVRITDYIVKYFMPSEGVGVYKTVGDLGRQYKYKENDCPGTVYINNAITMTAPNSGNMKYLPGNIPQFRFYQGSESFSFKAREGALIHYLKLEYTTSNNNTSVLNKYAASSSVALTDQILSDSILYVNDTIITLYVGTTDGKGGGQVRINNIYVVYTDDNAIVDDFDNCNAVQSSGTVNVTGVDGTYDWQITNFNRDSVRRMTYDQSIMLRKGGKIATVGTEGGIKELSFDWFANDKTKGAKFYVKAGGETFTTDSNAMGNYYRMTYTKTDIKNNGAFSIEVDANSGSMLEIGHISLTPYLLYTEKDANTTVGVGYKMVPQIDNRDDETDITYSVSGGVADVADDGTVTPATSGDMTVTATWGNVSTTYTLHVSGTLTLNEADDNASVIAAAAAVGQPIDVTMGRTFKAGMYNTICLPFGVSKTDLATAFGRTITSLAQYTQTASLDDAHKNLNVEIEDVEAIEAGNPYLLQFEGEDVTNPEFSQVTIVNTTGNTVGQGGTTQFIGTIGKKNIGAKENSVLFVIANNKLAWNNTGADSHMNGFRAYFNVPDMSDQSVAARLVFRQPATPTGNENVNENANVIRKMIINNQLIIIREGKMYNAQGAEF